jgi:type II secretory pathway component PulC
MNLSAVALSCALALSLVACGGAAQPAPATKAPQSTASASVAPDAPTVAGPVEVKRSTVKRFAERPGEFFQSIDLDERAVFADGKFHGFRLIALRDGLERSGLQPGDVVVSVNKMPIERPEHAIAVLRSLEKAKELRVDYERNGEPKSVTVPIVDDGLGQLPVTTAPIPPTPPATPAPAPASAPAK